MSETPNSATEAAELRAWLDARQAEAEHNHRDGWTGRSCYCDMPLPCEDRAYELRMIDGLRALLAERDALEEQRDIARYQLCGAQARLNYLGGDRA